MFTAHWQVPALPHSSDMLLSSADHLARRIAVSAWWLQSEVWSLHEEACFQPLLVRAGVMLQQAGMLQLCGESQGAQSAPQEGACFAAGEHWCGGSWHVGRSL